MSVTQANSYIKAHIQKHAPEIAAALYTDTRKLLDTRVTILDLSKNALKANLKKEDASSLADYDKIYDKLITVVSSNVNENRSFRTLEEAAIYWGDRLLNAPTFINNGDNDRFIIASSFAGIRSFVTTKISNDPRLVSSRFGLEAGKSKLDIGHIASGESENLTSPLEQKLITALSATSNPVIAAKIGNSLTALHKVQADFTYSFKNTAAEAIDSAKTVLGESYIVVTLHTATKNKEFSITEGAIFRNILYDIAKTLQIQDIPGSNTITQDVQLGIINIIKTGKAGLAKRTAVKGKTSTKNTGKAKNPVVVSPVIKTFQNRTFSLTSLQSLINTNLVHVIAANMGDGSRKDVLNYRTGRFAQSARVENLVQSKAGLITAFYSYMKNPYATFSVGGAQQFPHSRDPKLIIAQSIKEIAATKIANRMRSVSI